MGNYRTYIICELGVRDDKYLISCFKLIKFKHIPFMSLEVIATMLTVI